jgi:predicted AAA+ superfamily ATPase
VVKAIDYSHGVLKPMCSPFFPQLRKQLGPYLVDKTQLIEKIVNNGLNGNVHLVLRPRRCGKTTTLQMLKCLHLLTLHIPY